MLYSEKSHVWSWHKLLMLQIYTKLLAFRSFFEEIFGRDGKNDFLWAKIWANQYFWLSLHLRNNSLG